MGPVENGRPGIPSFLESDACQKLRSQLELLAMEDEGISLSKGAGPMYPTSFWNQLSILTARAWRANSRDQFMVYGRLCGSCIIAPLIGYGHQPCVNLNPKPPPPASNVLPAPRCMFYHSTRDAANIWKFCEVISFNILITLFFAMFGINRFIEERIHYWREHASGVYSPEVHHRDN